MGKTYTSIEIDLPSGDCFSYVKNSLKSPKFVAVYKTLHEGREYSGQIVEESENQRLVIEESAIDSVTRIRHSGWTITYDFEEIAPTKTRVAVSIEYGIFLALMGMTTTKAQSINEVLSRVNSLIALEHGQELASCEQADAADG